MKTELEQMDSVAAEVFTISCKFLAEARDMFAPHCDLLEQRIADLDRGRLTNERSGKVICNLFRRASKVDEAVARIQVWFNLEHGHCEA